MEGKKWLLLVHVYGTDEFHLINPLPNTYEHWSNFISMWIDFKDQFQYQFIDISQ
jgi:hypothetical protein